MTNETDFAMTHEEIATQLGISRQRVTALEKEALRKLAYKLKPYVGSAGLWEEKYDRLYRYLVAPLMGKEKN